ncbi:hypothetical protein PHYBLDRAFT_141406 [Phycomyces blakesleeanus NRRL 1555(-)]|uniref:Uncharacterized protein n=1 Tax=Phycomyces blakesleeanus (strain ATCC 8743b / DSM 1359 / FGSC 10004 / NBRC 33097 / NRRL 1555) TaxID=763407 RepID=A0A162US66_PHYB8|nr:hypothetical protein PHYBLDRAFT_141406 [Phycomyces blakesleeanus NRRL 1555(-)]OAD77523.1 hypothetical protein PHYBLDRAFT_141406 [Phycomyces blakesleeanus NRRL 1555(-)]|eukprot:XP_018295563.1 hypothetical protein PHYBLDRAFT_141406 [Phycomyces blakesleeanus NRRL 1555(-)]
MSESGSNDKVPSMSNELPDPKYKEEIASIIFDLENKGVVELSHLLKRLEQRILAKFRPGYCIRRFKGDWIFRIKRTATMLKIKLNKNEDYWPKIEEKLLAIVPDSENSIPSSVLISSDPTSWNRSATSTSSFSSKSSKMSAESTKKLLTADQKLGIEHVFGQLDKTLFWKLSNGVIVEEVMQKARLNCNFEHPCHSFILEIGDHFWETYFSNDELKEINEHGIPAFEEINKDSVEYLDEYLKLNNIDETYAYAFSKMYNPRLHSERSWIQRSVIQAACNFLYNKNMDKFSEADMLGNVWSIFTSVVEGSDINANSGEKSCVSNASVKNSKRSLDAISPTIKRRMGRKVDVIFSEGDIELGLIELGKSNDQTKSLSDGMKLMKLMKDTLVATTDQLPVITHKLRTVGFLLVGTKATMLSMDIPAGYVSRVRKMKPLYYPTNARQFTNRLIPILKLALKAKSTMIHTRNLYDNVTIEESPEEPITSGKQPACSQNTIFSEDTYTLSSCISISEKVKKQKSN